MKLIKYYFTTLVLFLVTDVSLAADNSEKLKIQEIIKAQEAAYTAACPNRFDIKVHPMSYFGKKRKNAKTFFEKLEYYKELNAYYNSTKITKK